MKTELLMVIMAGIVLSLFMIVGEIAAMRKRVKNIRARLFRMYQSGRILRLIAELSAIAAFFLIQPVIVAILAAMALDNLYPDFSDLVAQQLQHALWK